MDDLVKYSYTSQKDEPVKVNLNQVFGEVAEDLELSINENNAAIVCSVLPVINGSKVQMRQLLSNLLANAIKYKHEDRNPIIKITTQISEEKFDDHPAKKYHHITFADNGIGMEEAHLSKIFTIFQRLHMRNEYSGNGIGLAICKKIMENHSGKIIVESVHGEGSKFNLYFPL